MSIEACAGLVARGDPDRFMAVMAAPVAARARLFPLYAFNLEVARAPWVSEEPMIGEMRLQWWRDTVEQFAGSGPVRAHEVAIPLAEVARTQNLPLDVMDRLIAARRWDLYRDPFQGQPEMDEFLQDTGGGLMWLAAKALGAGPEVEPVARDAGWAAGLAAFLRAVPDLEARGRVPLSDRSPAAISALARRGLQRLAHARAARPGGAARWAFLTGWQTAGLLRQAERQPERVLEGRLALSEFARKGSLLWVQATGRW